MERDGQNFFSFWTTFCPFTPLTAQKSKFQKNEKNTWRYHHFTRVYQKLWLDDVRFLRSGARRMDGRTDGKSNTQKCVPHLKRKKFPSWMYLMETFLNFQRQIILICRTPIECCFRFPQFQFENHNLISPFNSIIF